MFQGSCGFLDPFLLISTIRAMLFAFVKRAPAGRAASAIAGHGRESVVSRPEMVALRLG
jgi:hypothetical protein